MSTKVLDLPLDLAFSLPPLDRFSFILQVLPTREAYLHLELVLFIEVRTQPGCRTLQSQRLGPGLAAAPQAPTGP